MTAAIASNRPELSDRDLTRLCFLADAIVSVPSQARDLIDSVLRGTAGAPSADLRAAVEALQAAVSARAEKLAVQDEPERIGTLRQIAFELISRGDLACIAGRAIAGALEERTMDSFRPSQTSIPV